MEAFGGALSRVKARLRRVILNIKKITAVSARTISAQTMRLENPRKVSAKTVAPQGGLLWEPYQVLAMIPAIQ